MRNKYRIVRDNYLGYEVQIKRWWFPFWMELGFCNTHPTIECARRYAETHAEFVVEYLGKPAGDAKDAS